MLVPELVGGLGNMMWTLSSTYALSKRYGHAFALKDIPMPPTKHSIMDYKTNILKQWVQFIKPVTVTMNCVGENKELVNSTIQRNLSETIFLRAYLQNYEFIRGFDDEIRTMFDLTSSVPHRYLDTDHGYFLQVRRGDFLQYDIHNLDLDDYYKRCVNRFPSSNVIHIVSNDMPWCQSWQFLDDYRCVFVVENEVDTLAVMKECAMGGVSANSTFGWWGLFLNVRRPLLCMPEVFFKNGAYSEFQYEFPGSELVSI
jgi:hypothetical protein